VKANAKLIGVRLSSTRIAKQRCVIVGREENLRCAAAEEVAEAAADVVNRPLPVLQSPLPATKNPRLR